MWSRHIEVFAFVVDFSRVPFYSVDSGLSIFNEGILPPAAFPKLLHNAHVLISHFRGSELHYRGTMSRYSMPLVQR